MGQQWAADGRSHGRKIHSDLNARRRPIVGRISRRRSCSNRKPHADLNHGRRWLIRLSIGCVQSPPFQLGIVHILWSTMRPGSYPQCPSSRDVTPTTRPTQLWITHGREMGEEAGEEG